MIKLNKKIKLIKNFKLEYSQSIVFPNLISYKDINSMFNGLMAIIKDTTEQTINKKLTEKQFSYNNLLNMYLQTLKQMNMYKSLYLSQIHSKSAI